MVLSGQKVNPERDRTMPRAIQLVMKMSGTSSAMTIGEWNKKFRVSRVVTWMLAVYISSIFIATTAGWSYNMYNKPIWAAGFPWWLPVVMLLSAYLIVVYLAMGYLTLFLPLAPFAVWKALDDVGFRGIGFAAILTSIPALLLDQAWLHITFACLLAVLIAAVLALCVCLDRTYGQ